MPLTGISILDLSRLLPGPLATSFLVELGASVVRVEHPVGGDPLRHWVPGQEPSPYFSAVNGGKTSVAIDLSTAEGQAELRRKARHADVVVESFRPGVLARWGLSYDVLRSDRPSAILCSVIGYASDGDMAFRAGHDLTYSVAAGMSMPDGDSGVPLTLPTQVADIVGGTSAALAILAALRHRDTTGEGAWVEVTLDSAATLAMVMPRAAAAAKVEFPLAGRDPAYGYYRCADDQWVAIAALEPPFFAALCAKLECEDLLQMDRNGHQREMVRSRLGERFATRGAREWVEHCANSDVCLELVVPPQPHEMPGAVRAHVPFRFRSGPALASVDAPPPEMP